METIFMNNENSRISEPKIFFCGFTDKKRLKNPNKNIALAILSTYYMEKH